MNTWVRWATKGDMAAHTLSHLQLTMFLKLWQASESYAGPIQTQSPRSQPQKLRLSKCDMGTRCCSSNECLGGAAAGLGTTLADTGVVHGVVHTKLPCRVRLCKVRQGSSITYSPTKDLLRVYSLRGPEGTAGNRPLGPLPGWH